LTGDWIARTRLKFWKKDEQRASGELPGIVPMSGWR